MRCPRPTCPGPGEIEDGYCNICGLAPPRAAAGVAIAPPTGPPDAVTSKPTRSTSRPTSQTSSTRARFGAGLVEIPAAPPQDPAAVVMVDPSVPEEKRYCSVCNEPVGRSHGDAAGRPDGFCRTCGRPYSFTPKLVSGDLVAGQYEVAGCLAHGGLGWIYLAKDRRVSDRWVVLKGLLNSGDSDAVAAAVAERRFLAEVEHPNIVKIHNFVEHRDDGYIVMEYVAGRSLRRLLEERRLANDGRPDPLPAAHAIAYVLEVLPALGHLHRSGLLFCDFKPDNVIQTSHSLKLIDLGGVYRVDDQTSPVYGTAGYQAPEIADTGPTIASDLYTVGRTLAVLTTEFRGYQTTYRFTLPDPGSVPLYTSFDSLFRFIARATAHSPDDRFQSAEEMADQLTGVLREIVAVGEGRPVPGGHKVFTAERRTAFDGPDPHTLPASLVRVDDPAAMFLASVTAADPDELLSLLQAAPDRSVEIDLRMARTLIDCGRPDQAAVHLDAVEARDPWEWRVTWYRGIASLAAGDTHDAEACFTSVYHAVPGELAPKLALAYVAEHRGDSSDAARWYDIVSRTDTAFPSAAFGLARCLAKAGDRRGAVAALDRVPAASSAHVEAQLAKVKVMVASTDGAAPDLADVAAASAVIERLALDDARHASLAVAVFEASVSLLLTAGPPPDSTVTVLGRPFTERDMRLGLEATYRTLARHAATPRQRVTLVERANQVRPRTLV